MGALAEVVLEMFQASLFVNEGLATFLSGPRLFRTLVCRNAFFQEKTLERHLEAEWRERVWKPTGVIAPHILNLEP